MNKVYHDLLNGRTVSLSSVKSALNTANLDSGEREFLQHYLEECPTGQIESAFQDKINSLREQINAPYEDAMERYRSAIEK